MSFYVVVLVDGKCVAIVPLWMVNHAIVDAVAKYPDSKIILEVAR